MPVTDTDTIHAEPVRSSTSVFLVTHPACRNSIARRNRFSPRPGTIAAIPTFQ